MGQHSDQSESNSGKTDNQDSKDKTDTDNKSHILIRRGKSLTNFSNLQDKKSIESKIARGRGGIEVIDEKETQDNGHTDSISLVMKEGKIQCESGYLMHFVPPHHTHLSIYDVISMPDNTAYPINDETLSSLPKWALGQLHETGHIQITAVYNREEKSFGSVQMGWRTNKNPYDRLIELTEDLDGDITSAAYYLAHNNASKEHAHASKIAEARGIEEESVEKSIKKVERKLSEK